MSNLLIVNFGTYVETNRFKAAAINGGFVSTDRMEDEPPTGELSSTLPGKIRTVRDAGVTVYSFSGLKKETWLGRLSSGDLYRDAFKDWMNVVLNEPIHCLYLTGHHWNLILSWGETTSHFHVRMDKSKQTLKFGITGKSVNVRTDKLRSECYAIFGFGCDVGTGTNSNHYQQFFRGGGTRPIILGWDGSISVPPRNAEAKKKVSDRFFYYLNKYYAPTNAAVPGSDRLKWFYQNQPMDIINAWGYATRYWFSDKARVRGKDGKLYRFRIKRGVEIPEAVKV
jgi:hypothetical protein